MPVRVRYYLFDNSGSLSHVPRGVVEGLYGQEDALPQYASSKQKVAEVILETETGKPVRILDIQGRYWTFDKEGKLEEENLAEWLAATQHREQKGRVVDIRPTLQRNAWKARNLWDVTGEDVQKLTNAIWPKLAEMPVSITSVKGKSPKRPPLTNDAQRALNEIITRFSIIPEELKRLSEPSLKGLAFEARQMASSELDGSKLWAAVADEADRVREIKARHRTGRGKWHAVLHVWLSNAERSEMQEIETIEEGCDGKEGAIEAARRLLAAHASKFGENVSIEAQIYCDLEWQEPTRD